MSNLLPLPLTITIPTVHQRLLREVRGARHSVLSLDPVRRALTIWYWPSDDEDLRRLPPSELGEYRQSHKFHYPYCFCSLFAPSGGSAPTEVAVLIETEGTHSGLYVAKCAKSECGYLVLLEQIYSQFGVPGKRYPRRDSELEAPNEERPRHVLHVSEVERENQLQESAEQHAARRQLKRRASVADLGDPVTPRRVLTPHNHDGAPRRCRVLGPSNPSPFQQLNSPTRSGLTAAEFRRLFSRCGQCSRVMTRDVFTSHTCREVIDLTTDED